MSRADSLCFGKPEAGSGPCRVAWVGAVLARLGCGAELAHYMIVAGIGLVKPHVIKSWAEPTDRSISAIVGLINFLKN